MIYYLGSPTSLSLMRYCLATKGTALTSTVVPVPYQALSRVESPPAGTYVFTNLERFGRTQLARWWDRLDGANARLLNDPHIVPGRRQLTDLLFANGVNDFRAYRVTERPRRFPVFVRTDRLHSGPVTDLIHSQPELDRTLMRLVLGRKDLRNLLVVEFSDTRDDDGYYAKFGAFYIAGRVLPRHLFFSDRWTVKYATSTLPRHIEAERTYVETNPHERAVADVFRLAGIDFGRVDYSVAGDALRIWEINTNPTFFPPVERDDGSRREIHERFADALVEAFRSIDSGRSIDEDAGAAELLRLARARRWRGENTAALRARRRARQTLEWVAGSAWFAAQRMVNR